MNEIITFEFKNMDVRVIEDGNGNPWWVAGDVCEILELKNTSMSIGNLDDDEKGINKVYTPGGEQSVVTINEPGLYTLILRSNKPEAKAFKRWITHEVLPSIRKTGEYKTLNTPWWAIEANGVEYLLTKFDAPKSMIATETMKHVHQIGGPDLRDKVGELPCSQNILDEEVMLEPTELGKSFGLSAIKMNKLLEEFNLQEKVNGSWTPTEEGAQICSRHLWNSAGKSGYNLKWSKSKIENIINQEEE